MLVAVAVGVVGRAVAVEVGARVVVATGLCVTFVVGVVVVVGPAWCVRSAGRKIAADAIPMSSASIRSSTPALLLLRRLPRSMGLTTVAGAGSGAGVGCDFSVGVSRSAG